MEIQPASCTLADAVPSPPSSSSSDDDDEEEDSGGKGVRSRRHGRRGPPPAEEVWTPRWMLSLQNSASDEALEGGWALHTRTLVSPGRLCRSVVSIEAPNWERGSSSHGLLTAVEAAVLQVRDALHTSALDVSQLFSIKAYCTAAVDWAGREACVRQAGASWEGAAGMTAVPVLRAGVTPGQEACVLLEMIAASPT